MRRRAVLGTALALAAARPAGAAEATLVHSARPGAPFRADAYAVAGVFDLDWLLEPRFTRLLDTMAASPGAFRIVRVFGVLNAGEREAVFPTSSGSTWPGPDAAMNFSTPLAALDALVREQLAVRAQARARRDFAAADAVRDRLAAAGVAVTDTAAGATWSLAHPSPLAGT